MSPETRTFIDEIRHAEDPTAGDERRVHAALYAALAASSVTGASVAASKATKLFGVSGASGLKLVGGLVFVGAAVWLARSVPFPSDAGEPAAADRRLIALSPIATRAAIETSARAVPSIATTASPQPSAPPVRAEAARRGSSPADPRSGAPSVREEIQLLADVREALARGDGAAALVRLDEHVTTDRQFAAERSAARIFSLCSLGRTREARLAADAFLRDHPRSVQRTAVERSCAAGETNDAR
jgi:hypothetical protein